MVLVGDIEEGHPCVPKIWEIKFLSSILERLTNPMKKTREKPKNLEYSDVKDQRETNKFGRAIISLV